MDASRLINANKKYNNRFGMVWMVEDIEWSDQKAKSQFVTIKSEVDTQSANSREGKKGKNLRARAVVHTRFTDCKCQRGQI